MTIEERLTLLAEAEDFFANLSEAGAETYRLGLRKAAAVGTVLGGLKLYKEEILDEEDRTEESLETALNFVLRQEFIDEMVEKYKLKEKDLDFYLGGFGLAKGIMINDKETIKGLRELQVGYKILLKGKYGDGVLFDMNK